MSAEPMEYIDENENNTERQALEAEILQLIAELNKTKQEMFELYSENKDKLDEIKYKKNMEIQSIDTIAENPGCSSKTICPSEVQKEPEITNNEVLVSMFYNKLVNIKWGPKLDTVRFAFPGFGKKKYGLRFNCVDGDQFNLIKCWLPKTFNMDDTKQNSYPVAFDEIPGYVGIVLENINAFYWREKQVNDLKNVLDGRVTLQCRPCYTEIDLNFNIITLDSSAKKNVTLYLSYPMLNILPATIDVISEGDVLLRRYLEAIFAVFKEETLVKAYQQAFVNSDQLKFFV